MTYLVIFMVFILFLAAIILLRTLKFARPPDVFPRLLEKPPQNEDEIANHLAEIIRCQTISYDENIGTNRHAFFELHRTLERNYPAVHKHLKREYVNEYSLLYTWQGSQPDLPGILMTAHLDVVPVEESSLSEWTHPPFSGTISDGYVWGRGTLDIKNQVTALLECVENMISIGYQPERTIFLAFGHDEEVSGFNGAAAIASLLGERGIHLTAVLDEGGAIYQEVLPGVRMPVAMIGVAEKGYLSLELEVQSAPGHSSMPPSQTAIGILSKALYRLEKHSLPAKVHTIQPMFKGIGLAAPLPLQMVIANLWLFSPLVRRVLQQKPVTKATIQTTIAITMISGGVKDNILPNSARAVVNFRILPGDSVASVCEWVRKTIDDNRVAFRPLESCAWEPSPISPHDADSFHQLERTIHQIFGELPVAPFLVLGATDARHYCGLCDTVYRFSPLLMTPEDVPRIHGINERINIEALEKMVFFYEVLLRSWGKGSDTD